MEETCANRCTVCYVLLPGTQRRKLYSSASSEALTVLKDLLDRLSSSETLPSEPHVFLQHEASGSSAYLCLRCFANLKKLNKAQSEVDRLQAELSASILGTCSKRGLRPRCPSHSPEREAVSVSGPGDTPRRSGIKRPLADISATLPPPKRHAQDTPTRQAFQQTVVEGSPAVSVLVKGKQAKVHHLTRSLKKIGKGLGRRSASSVGYQVMKHNNIRSHVLKVLGRDIRKEMKTMCSVMSPSILRETEPEVLQSFTWESLIEELNVKAPTLLNVLRSCVAKKPVKPGRRSYRVKEEAVIGICAAILLRNRNQSLNLVQRIVSMILYSNHAGKRVYTRLQKLLLCLSHSRSVAYVDVLGAEHDKPVLSWKESLERQVFHPQASMSSVEIEDHVVLGSQVSLEEQHVTDFQFPEVLTSPVTLRQNSSEGQSSSRSPSQVSETTSQCSTPIAPDFSPLSSVSSHHPPSPSSSSDITASGTSQTDASDPSVPDVPAPALARTPAPAPTPHYPTMKIVGDNIDKHVKPREMRIDAQASMLHYFNLFAVRDRVDTSSLEDEPSIPDLSAIDVGTFLPTPEEHGSITRNFQHMIARVLKQHMPFFAKFGSGLERHLKHSHYEEMSRESEVVPLGILPKCETSHEDMVSILEHIQQYVPTMSVETTVDLPNSSDTTSVTADYFHYLLFGGDQLTEKRAQGAQDVRSNSERGKDRLEGLLPVAEDWHAKVCLLGVIWKRLYSCDSGCDAGTVYHLRNVINRRNVVKVPKDRVNACEEFFLLIVEGYILAAAMQVFGMKTLEDKPSSDIFPNEAADKSPRQRKRLFLRGVKKITDKYVNLSYPASEESEDDHIFAYTREVISMGVLLMEFNDAIREGDGERIIQCWKFFLPVFKASNRTNYSNTALRLLAQHRYLFTPRMKQQLLWSRTINTHGRPGKNISCDLHMEHLNRACKNAIGSLGPNISDASVERIGKSVLKLSKVTDQFDTANNVRSDSGHHSKRSAAKDLERVLSVLKEQHVAEEIPGRKHDHFPNFQSNVARTLEQKSFKQWMTQRLRSLIPDYV